MRSGLAAPAARRTARPARSRWRHESQASLRTCRWPLALRVVATVRSSSRAAATTRRTSKYPRRTAAKPATSPSDTNVTTGRRRGRGRRRHRQHAPAASAGPRRARYDDGFKAWRAATSRPRRRSSRGDERRSEGVGRVLLARRASSSASGTTPGAQKAYSASVQRKSDNELAMGAYALYLAHTGHPGEADTFLTDKHSKSPKSRAPRGVPRRGEVAREGQRQRAAARAGRAAHRPELQGRDDRHRARPLPRGPDRARAATRSRRSSTASARRPPRATRTTPRRTSSAGSSSVRQASASPR